jgi:glycosyltransferase involved in cell wall biosynthesis
MDWREEDMKGYKKRENKNVCMIAYRYIPKFISRVKIARALCENTYSVDFICPKEQNQEYIEKIDKINVFRIKDTWQKEETYLKLLINYLLFTKRAFFRVLQLNKIKNHSYFHIHTPPDFLILIAIPFKLINKAKIILDLHDMLPEAVASNLNLNNNHIFVRIARLIERLAINCSDAIICTNAYDKEIILSRNIIDPEIIFVVMNTPDIELFKIEHLRKEDFGLEKKFVILFEGTIWKRRGIQTVIEAVEKLKDKIPIHFVILGDGPDLDYLKNIVNEKKLKEFIKFTGWVDLKTLSEYISISDACLIPFLKTKVNERGVPNKLFEYIVHEKPVIASRLTGMSLTFSDNEVLFFEPGNATDLAEKILWAYNNPKEIGRMVNNAKQRYEKEYTWDNVEKELYKCYESVV